MRKKVFLKVNGKWRFVSHNGSKAEWLTKHSVFGLKYLSVIPLPAGEVKKMKYRIQIELQADGDSEFENAQTLQMVVTTESNRETAERLFYVFEDLLQMVNLASR